ncbi:MAG: M20/M25/M40 family metallo-hydrolase [Coriobacteriia bacterium]|nr:M20/M25/M40 family metallo-hydrolase [Coriobacteriia bacterium]MCL2537018.1 M20/M25/M40 family metallo-hydrolase [Coriobacteriia bacterium]
MSDALFTLVENDAPTRRQQLGELVSYQSLAFPGYDPAVAAACASRVAELCRELGFNDIELLDIGSQNPTVWAETKVDPDALTVLMYAHYDVQPAPLEQGWTSDPWEMSEADGRLYGRGVADNKAGIVQHLSALRCLLEDRGLAGVDALPFSIKICFEGEEEYGDSLPRYIPTDAERFKADIFLVCDGGNLEIGKPVLQQSLRGIVEQTISIRTLPNALHSGAFGGPAPDAFLALTKLIQSCYDADDNTAIEGIVGSDFAGSVDYSDDLFRKQAEMAPGAPLVGTGSIATRLWARPALKVVGVDMTNVETSSNVITPEVRARFSLRFPAGQKGADVLEYLRMHIWKETPWGADVVFEESVYMNAFEAGSPDGQYTKLMADCLTQAFDYPCSDAASGGSIPLLGVLQEVSPDAEFLLFGPIDSELSNIHGANESVSIEELTACTKAETLFLSKI